MVERRVVSPFNAGFEQVVFFVVLHDSPGNVEVGLHSWVATHQRLLYVVVGQEIAVITQADLLLLFDQLCHRGSGVDQSVREVCERHLQGDAEWGDALVEFFFFLGGGGHRCLPRWAVIASKSVIVLTSHLLRRLEAFSRTALQLDLLVCLGSLCGLLSEFIPQVVTAWLWGKQRGRGRPRGFHRRPRAEFEIEAYVGMEKVDLIIAELFTEGRGFSADIYISDMNSALLASTGIAISHTRWMLDARRRVIGHRKTKAINRKTGSIPFGLAIDPVTSVQY
jgi:hypothetical protein